MRASILSVQTDASKEVPRPRTHGWDAAERGPHRRDSHTAGEHT